MKNIKNALQKSAQELEKVANKSKNSINKPKKRKQIQKIVQNDQNPVSTPSKEKKETQESKPFSLNGADIKVEPKNVDAKVLANIEKRKAKKLAKKLKKKQQTEEQETQESKPSSLNGTDIKVEPKNVDSKILANIEKRKAKKLAKKLKKKQQTEEQKMQESKTSSLSGTDIKVEPKNLDSKVLANIEKRKAKNLAKKLKKKQQTEEQETQESKPSSLNGTDIKVEPKNVDSKILAHIEKRKAKKLAKKLKKNQQTKEQETQEFRPSSLNGTDIKVEPNNLDAKVLANIEKRKAKKLAKKLKKKQQTEEQNSLFYNLPKAIGQSNSQKKDKQKDKLNKLEQKEEIQSVPDNLPKTIEQQNGQKEDKETKKLEQKEEILSDPDNLPKNIEEQSGQKKDKKKKKLKKLEQKKVVQPGPDNLPRALDRPNGQKKGVQKEEGGKAKDSLLSSVFIGNLPVTVKRVQIANLFAEFGGVKGIRFRTAEGQVLFKHKQRKLAGSLNAYVFLNDAEAAEKALKLNGIEFKGNHLRVTPADKKKTQSGHDPKRTVVVGNLKHSANEKKLHEIFSNCGEIDYIRCIRNDRGCIGVAFVCFKSPEAVGLALELNETVLDERPIHVERYSKNKSGAKEAREKQKLGTQKPKASGAKKRIEAKQLKANHGKVGNSLEKRKKSDFHGLKSTGISKKKNFKKLNNEMKGLAKKIAPKIKKEGQA